MQKDLHCVFGQVVRSGNQRVHVVFQPMYNHMFATPEHVMHMLSRKTQRKPKLHNKNTFDFISPEGF